MDGNSKSKAQELVNKLEEGVLQESTVITDDPISGIKSETISFIRSSLQRVAQNEEFEEILKDTITNVIKETPLDKIDLSDLTVLLNQSRMRSSDERNSILGFIKPAQGVSSPFLPVDNHVDSPEEDIFANASPATLKVMNSLSKALLQKVAEENNKGKIVD